MKHRHKAISFVGSCTLIALTAACNSQALFSDTDPAHAEKHWIEDRSRPSLHMAERFPDGANGGISEVLTEPDAPNIVIPHEFANLADYEAHGMLCNADALILGKWVKSRSILNSYKSDIFTVSTFVVEQVIKSDGVLKPGATVLTIRRGGEVTDAGEVLRIVNHDAPPYEPGRSYLLELNADKGAKTRQYFASDYGTITVAWETIIPSQGKWVGFLPGTPYSVVLMKIQELSVIPCSVN